MEQYILWRRNCLEISRTLYLMHTQSHSISMASSKKGKERLKKNEKTHLASLQTHTFFKKTYPLTIFSSQGGGENISMISLTFRHFQLENPREKFQYISRPLLHSRHHFYIWNPKISNFLVCVLFIFFSFVCSTHFFSIKKGKRKMWKKVFLGSCPSPFLVPLFVFSSENVWTVQTYT